MLNHVNNIMQAIIIAVGENNVRCYWLHSYWRGSLTFRRLPPTQSMYKAQTIKDPNGLSKIGITAADVRDNSRSLDKMT